MTICNPKQNSRSRLCRTSWYPYYAGYSVDFVDSILNHLQLKPDSTILDPWNGSGTTTYAAARNGYSAIGFDLNPVMVIAAKAMFVEQAKGSLVAIGQKIICDAAKEIQSVGHELDPLDAWFAPSATLRIRTLESAIQSNLVDIESQRFRLVQSDVHNLSPLCCFFYVALFRSVRELLTPLRASNPTWIRLPETTRNRLRPSLSSITNIFSRNIKEMDEAIRSADPAIANVRFDISCSTALALKGKSIDCVITSPPYCTRIDYAVATRPELYVLGIGPKTGFSELRRGLLGSTAVSPISDEARAGLGETCDRVLSRIFSHDSVASKSYYYKTFWAYFRDMAMSIAECNRVLRKRGTAVFVVQDSYYKDIHVNLQAIIEEMFRYQGLDISERFDFKSRRSMAHVNTRSRIYGRKDDAIESVLLFSNA